MTIKILLSYNPFCVASATSNRWLTLIEGLSELGCSIQLLVYGNYQSRKEKEMFSSNSSYKGIEIKYLTSKIVTGIWQRRYHNYLGRYIQLIQSKRKVKNELFNFTGFIWTENDVEIWKIIASIPEKSFKLVAEMSEFLDIHNFNKGNVLQRKLGDKKQLFFEKHYFRQLDGFVLMTKTLMNHYQHFTNHQPKMLHLPMTVDLTRFNSEYDGLQGFERPYIVFVGVMNDEKDGVSILIEAFAKIHKQFPEQKLYLIGGWNYDTPQHQKLIKTYNLENKVFWKGEFLRDQIPAILKNATLLTLPRPDSKQAQGGFPTKLGEYLASGNPVCATRVGEIPQYLRDNESVFFADPGSVESFAIAMERALSNPELAHKVGIAGRNIAESHFNKDIQAKKLYEFLQTL